MTEAIRSAALLVVILAGACGGARPSVETARSPERLAPDHRLSEIELGELREVVARLAPGTRMADVRAAMGHRLDGLGVLGAGPQTESTEIYPLGDRNVLWLTYDASDESNVFLLRAVVWNEATDPMPPALPYPPPAR